MTIRSGIAAIAVFVLLPTFAAAQDEAPGAGTTAAAEQDLTVPPTITAVPGQTQLEPAAAERDDMLQTVVTEGQDEFGLPDLGTSLREQRESERSDQRIIVNPIRLYDPEADPSVDDNFLEAGNLRNVGFIEVIRWGFGRNRRED